MIMFNGKMFKEVDEKTTTAWGHCCEGCWFGDNDDVDCLELRDKGLLPPCSEYHREDRRNVIFVEAFPSLDVGNSFKYEDKELVVCSENDYGCEGCYFEYNEGWECGYLQDTGAIPYCSEDKRTDIKNVIFTEKMQSVFIKHSIKDIEKIKNDAIFKAKKVLGDSIEIIDTVFKDDGVDIVYTDLSCGGLSEKMEKLKDTIELMKSENYKDRFKAEYWQTKIRYNNLKSMLDQWDKGELDFEPACSRVTYDAQLRVMKEYVMILEMRAQEEKIDLQEELREKIKKEMWQNTWNM